MEEISFQSGGLRLDGTVFYPPNKKDKNPAILFVHGWTSGRDRRIQYAEALVKLGFICFLFDLRGHGASEGDRDDSSNKDFLNDCVAAYDYLLNLERIDPDNISAVGSSFGGFLVALLTSKRKIKNLVLRAPADYRNEVFEAPKRLAPGGEDPKVMKWREQAKSSRDTFALEAVNNYDGNVLIIESELDEQVPHQILENYINAEKDKSKLTHIVMKGAPHSIKEGKFRDEVVRILVDWFKRL